MKFAYKQRDIDQLNELLERPIESSLGQVNRWHRLGLIPKPVINPTTDFAKFIWQCDFVLRHSRKRYLRTFTWLHSARYLLGANDRYTAEALRLIILRSLAPAFGYLADAEINKAPGSSRRLWWATVDNGLYLRANRALFNKPPVFDVDAEWTYAQLSKLDRFYARWATSFVWNALINDEWGTPRYPVEPEGWPTEAEFCKRFNRITEFADEITPRFLEDNDQLIRALQVKTDVETTINWSFFDAFNLMNQVYRARADRVKDQIPLTRNDRIRIITGDAVYVGEVFAFVPSVVDQDGALVLLDVNQPFAAGSVLFIALEDEGTDWLTQSPLIRVELRQFEPGSNLASEPEWQSVIATHATYEYVFAASVPSS